MLWVSPGLLSFHELQEILVVVVRDGCKTVHILDHVAFHLEGSRRLEKSLLCCQICHSNFDHVLGSHLSNETSNDGVFSVLGELQPGCQALVDERSCFSMINETPSGCCLLSVLYGNCSCWMNILEWQFFIQINFVHDVH